MTIEPVVALVLAVTMDPAATMTERALAEVTKPARTAHSHVWLLHSKLEQHCCESLYLQEKGEMKELQRKV